MFFLATGFHGLHVTGGLIAFVILLGRTFLARTFTHEQAVSAVVVSYYWHFVDVVWIASLRCDLPAAVTSVTSGGPASVVAPITEYESGPSRRTLRRDPRHHEGTHVRHLSARRRHPAAKGVLLVLALFLMGSVYAVLAPSPRWRPTPATQQIEEGRALFQVGCASCHGLNGEGQITDTIQGPPLIGVGAAVDFQVESGRMPMAPEGRRRR